MATARGDDTHLDRSARLSTDLVDVVGNGTETSTVTDEAAAHLTPAQHDHINFYGTYSFDIDAELRP